jgi:hypothetical protein
MKQRYFQKIGETISRWDLKIFCSPVSIHPQVMLLGYPDVMRFRGKDSSE